MYAAQTLLLLNHHELSYNLRLKVIGYITMHCSDSQQGAC
jgi:hypothetical protein